MTKPQTLVLSWILVDGNQSERDGMKYDPIEIKVKEVKSESSVVSWLFATLWTVESMEFSRPEYWSG